MRRIIARTSGKTHGPITRLMSPSDLGHLLKPFIFLDYLEAKGTGPNFGFHPHSGIATLTFPLTFDIEHTTSTGQVDTVKQGGVEWVVAGLSYCRSLGLSKRRLSESVGWGNGCP